MRLFAWIEMLAGALAVMVALASDEVSLPVFYGGLGAIIAAIVFLAGDPLADHPADVTPGEERD